MGTLGAPFQSQLIPVIDESIDVIVDIDHTYRGDLDIILQSPYGTESWLAVSNGDSNDYSVGGQYGSSLGRIEYGNMESKGQRCHFRRNKVS